MKNTLIPELQGLMNRMLLLKKSGQKGFLVNKFRSTLVALVALLSLIGPSFLAGPLTNVASGVQARSIHSSYVTGKAAGSMAVKRNGPCPTGGGSDC
jgi:hypothetical protein